MSDIIITGYQGSGKTSLGKGLVQRGVIDIALDTDEVTREIHLMGKNIGNYIRSHGDVRFRLHETKGLIDCILVDRGNPRSIITSGGGLVIQDRNYDLLRENGYAICYLDVELTEMIERVKRDVKGSLDRVEFDEKAFIDRYLSRREIYYSRADVVVHNLGNISDTVDDFITKVLVK